IASRGRLVDLGTLRLVGSEVERAGNSAFRLRQVFDRFALTADQSEQLPTLAGPVLLVDDLVDSRWTLTVAARLLRSAGAASVLPFALAAVG
ncbi:MAG TPA: recombinase RecQ, partial [Propionicimonas sp.]|nr:recombinase RecQ [Propionicimonas sp.]